MFFSFGNCSVKKLHQVLLLLPTPNLFYQPNLERKLAHKWHDDIIGSTKFQSNQMEMNCVWQIIEESSDIYEISLKNMYFYLEKMGIDLKSSVQLIFDVFSQLIEVILVFLFAIDAQASFSEKCF